MSFSNSGVYLIRNKVSGKMYVGSSKDIESRWKDHKRRLNNGIHKNEHLQRAWKKYGESGFTFTTIETCEREMLVELEQKYIDKYDSINKGYNQREAGSIGQHSEETKKKMSEWQKGIKRKPLSEETKRKISEALKGKKKSEETRKRMSEAQYNKSEEHKRRISEAKMGHTVSEETRKKISESQKGKRTRLGKKHSEETKRKISESLKRRRESNT